MCMGIIVRSLLLCLLGRRFCHLLVVVVVAAVVVIFVIVIVVVLARGRGGAEDGACSLARQRVDNGGGQGCSLARAMTSRRWGRRWCSLAGATMASGALRTTVPWHWWQSLARWRDDELVVGPTVKLARGRKNESAAGRRMVLACSRNDESAAGADRGARSLSC